MGFVFLDSRKGNFSLEEGQGLWILLRVLVTSARRGGRLLEGTDHLCGGGGDRAVCGTVLGPCAVWGDVSDTELGPSAVFTGPGQHAVLQDQAAASQDYPP